MILIANYIPARPMPWYDDYNDEGGDDDDIMTVYVSSSVAPSEQQVPKINCPTG